MHKCVLAFTAFTILSSLSAQAEDWPAERPIHVIVPLTGGSGADLTARLLVEKMAENLHQAMVVDNRPGAATAIGSADVAKAAGDGYTLLINSSALTIIPFTQKLSYDTAVNLKPIIPLGNLTNVLVATRGKFKTLNELIAAAKQKGDDLSYVSLGLGSTAQLTAERFGRTAGFKALGVPFKGSPEGLKEVIAGRVDFYFCPLPPALSLIRAEKIDALAVSSSSRSSLLPNVPTVAEAGFADATYDFWIGLFAPGTTPEPIADRLHAVAKAALELPELQARLKQMGEEPMPMTRTEFSAFVSRDLARNAQLIKDGHLAPKR
jgi:tripartite-type tricarboxylate transporter receptor subunit TctC